MLAQVFFAGQVRSGFFVADFSIPYLPRRRLKGKWVPWDSLLLTWPLGSLGTLRFLRFRPLDKLTRECKETFSAGTLLDRECHLSVHLAQFSECLLSVPLYMETLCSSTDCLSQTGGMGRPVCPLAIHLSAGQKGERFGESRIEFFD